MKRMRYVLFMLSVLIGCGNNLWSMDERPTAVNPELLKKHKIIKQKKIRKAQKKYNAQAGLQKYLTEAPTYYVSFKNLINGGSTSTSEIENKLAFLFPTAKTIAQRIEVVKPENTLKTLSQYYLLSKRAKQNSSAVEWYEMIEKLVGTQSHRKGFFGHAGHAIHKYTLHGNTRTNNTDNRTQKLLVRQISLIQQIQRKEMDEKFYQITEEEKLDARTETAALINNHGEIAQKELNNFNQLVADKQKQVINWQKNKKRNLYIATALLLGGASVAAYLHYNPEASQDTGLLAKLGAWAASAFSCTWLIDELCYTTHWYIHKKKQLNFAKAGLNKEQTALYEIYHSDSESSSDEEYDDDSD